MDYFPSIKSANVRREFPAGKYKAVLYDNIESTSSVRYLYVIAMFGEGGQALFFVTSEVNTAAKRFGGGSHFLCVFDGERHSNLGGSDEWADAEKFTMEALKIIKKKFVI